MRNGGRKRGAALLGLLLSCACSSSSSARVHKPSARHPSSSKGTVAAGAGGASAAGAKPESADAGASNSGDAGNATASSNDAGSFSFDAAVAMAPADGLPGADRPHTLPPEKVGVLIGPGAAHPPSGVQFFGTDLGITYEHDDRLVIMFGDTWTSPTFICDHPDPTNDDTMGTLPRSLGSEMPGVTLLSDAATPSSVSTITLMRGTTSLGLGSAKVPMTGFSDGQREYAFFARYAPTRCGSTEPGAPGCPLAEGFQCSARVGECQPPYGSVILQCDAEAMSGCYPGQNCAPETQAFCFDPDSPEFDGSVNGEVTAVSQDVELGVRRAADSTVYDSVGVFASNKFANLTARAVQTFTGKRDGNDYSPGHGALLVWGRPGFTGEQGREARLYLMVHDLPFALDGKGQLDFRPRYFAGIDAASGEPLFSEHQSEAKPLALDGMTGGQPRESEHIVDQMAVSWLGAPIDKWVMLYGGDISDLLLQDPAGTRSEISPGAIMIRFADQPWGPWSPAVPHLVPGNPTHAGDPYGPGGFLFHPGCSDLGDLKCTPSDPLRPQDALLPGCPIPAGQPDPGRLYGVSIIDSYTRANGSDGLDLFWNVSTWNPYAVVLMKTTIRSARGSSEPEFADVQRLARLSDWRALPLLPDQPSKYRQESSHDRGTTDDSFPISNHGNRDFNNFICASKDANLDPTQMAPFKFDQSACDEDYVHGAVIGRFEGQGSLVRIWFALDSLLNDPASGAVLRIYRDDDPKPLIEVPVVDAMSGQAGEIFAPPFGAGSPHRLAWYYPVAFHHKLVVAVDNIGAFDEVYYHCDAVLDAAGSSDALPSERLEERDLALGQLNALEHPVIGIAQLGKTESVMLGAGESRTIESAGPATVYELLVRAPSADVSSLANVHVSVRWDDAAVSAIDLGLLELLGANRVPPDNGSLALRSYLDKGGRVLALRLPMPFAKSAAFSFRNDGSAAAQFELELWGEPRVPASAFGHLHTQRNETLGPTTASQHVAVQATGRGRVVGVCSLDEGHADPNVGSLSDPLNMLEGDVRATVDGELALDGTGSEEYADDVFYFTDAPHGTAFDQAYGVFDDSSRKPPGQASFCRWHVLGTELDFTSAIELSFELGGAGNPSVVDRQLTVAYLYLAD